MSEKAKNVYGNKTPTAMGIISYPVLFEPQPNELKNNRLFYSCKILLPKDKFPKEAIVELPLVKEMQRIAEIAFGPTKKTIGSHPNKAIKDGDALLDKDGNIKTGHSEAGHWVITASTVAEKRPVCIDKYKNVITDPSEIYGGAIGLMFVTPCTYWLKHDNFGVTLYLVGVQKIADGESFGGSRFNPATDAATTSEVPDYLKGRVVASAQTHQSGIPSWSPSSPTGQAMATHFDATQVADDDIPF